MSPTSKHWVALAISIAPWVIARPAGAQCDCPAEEVVVIGHRGAGTDDGTEAFSENTIESVERAFSEGVGMVEIDVQLTADGAVVLMHDDTVDRTTDGTGCVSALALAEIQAFRTTSGAAPPTLSELFVAVNGDVNVEVKLHETAACPAQDLNALADAVVAAIEADTVERRVLVSSFDLDVLRRIRSTAPSIEIGYLSAAPDDIDVATAEGFEAIHLIAAVASARTVRRAHDAGLRVNVWTVDGERAVQGVLDAGVDGVITDTGAEAVAAVSAWCDAYVCPMDAGTGLDAGTGGADAGGSETGGGCAVATGGGSPAGWLVLAFAFRRRNRHPHRA